uniref:Uncharacterized protein n=1 Tax=Fagus sylvatica TaxID=28930 RepID=A0A2N9J0C2_FAGSY
MVFLDLLWRVEQKDASYVKEVIISGKAQGSACQIYEVLRMGVLGIKVKIILDWDPMGKVGPRTPLRRCLIWLPSSHPRWKKNTTSRPHWGQTNIETATV